MTHSLSSSTATHPNDCVQHRRSSNVNSLQSTPQTDPQRSEPLFSPLGLTRTVGPSHRTVSGGALPSSDGSSASSPSGARHWSVFYPEGIEVLPPVSLHYLHLGCWCTIAGGWDYFSHKNLRKGEVIGHRVEWLHTALPRDRFVFLVEPVEARQQKSLWGMIWKLIYGQPPAFAFARGKLLWRIQEGSAAQEWMRSRRANTQRAAANSQAPQETSTMGVEAIEVLHSDITAIDYAPGMTSSRLAIETKVASALWFNSPEEAYSYYGCLDKLPPSQVDNSAGDSRVAKGRAAMPTAVLHRREDSHPMYTYNGSGLSDGGTREGKDGGEAIGLHEVEGLMPISRNASTMEPRSPQPSPDSGPGVPCVLQDPEVLVLPPSTVFTPTYRSSDCSMLHALHRQPPASSAGALSSVETPLGTPELRSHVARVDADTAQAEHAAAELLHLTGECNEKPVHRQQHFNTMVTVYTQDPHFNAVLREVLLPEPGTFPFTTSVQEQKRLLSLYEAGMPSWTIFVTRYGLPYRRWFRLFAVMLVNIWPLIALCVGLYDLYKHMPYLTGFLSDTLAPVTAWIDHHFTLRISMLVTYLVTVSYSVLYAFHAFVKSIVALMNLLVAPILPLLQLVALLAYPVKAVYAAVVFMLGPVFSLVWALWLTVKLVLAGPFKAIYFVFRSIGFAAGPGVPSATAAVQQASYFMLWWKSWLDFWDKVARPIKNVAKAAYDGIVHVGVSTARREASIRRWYTAKLRSVSTVLDVYIDCVQCNWSLFWYLPSWRPLLMALVVIAFSVATLVVPS